MRCAARTPPSEATGAHLTALQPHTQAQHTHPQQTSRQRPAHARTATPPRPPPTITAPATTTHPSQPQPPRPRSTNTRGHKLNHSNTNSTQRSDQHKHQTSRRRNNREPKTETQTPQGVTAPTPFPDRFASTALTTCASLEHESITFAHYWEAVNPRNHAENSVLVCCSAHVRNGLKSSLPWFLSLA